MVGIVLAVIVFAIIAANKNNTELIPEGIESAISGNTENNETGTIDQPATTKPVVTKPTTTTTTTTTSSTAKTFTIAQVATHNSEANCYSAINGNVYDLTAFITKHPGGDRNILRICGIDGSAAFDGQHGGDSKPERILAGFEVGTLIK
jgi:cytochrome b involved in lipid metabolism